MDWMRGRMNLLDPVGLLGALGYLNFFVAPFIHVMIDQWMMYITPPPDWREWLGKMALVDAAAIAVYLIVCRIGSPGRVEAPFRPWVIGRPAAVLGIALIGTAALQAYVYAHFGGIDGYIALFE